MFRRLLCRIPIVLLGPLLVMVFFSAVLEAAGPNWYKIPLPPLDRDRTYVRNMDVEGEKILVAGLYSLWLWTGSEWQDLAADLPLEIYSAVDYSDFNDGVWVAGLTPVDYMPAILELNSGLLIPAPGVRNEWPRAVVASFPDSIMWLGWDGYLWIYRLDTQQWVRWQGEIFSQPNAIVAISSTEAWVSINRATIRAVDPYTGEILKDIGGLPDASTSDLEKIGDRVLMGYEALGYYDCSGVAQIDIQTEAWDRMDLCNIDPSLPYEEPVLVAGDQSQTVIVGKMSLYDNWIASTTSPITMTGWVTQTLPFYDSVTDLAIVEGDTVVGTFGVLYTDQAPVKNLDLDITGSTVVTIGETSTYTLTYTGEMPAGVFWDFGDGYTATGISVSHAWNRGGLVTITVEAGNIANGVLPAEAKMKIEVTGSILTYLPTILKNN